MMRWNREEKELYFHLYRIVSIIFSSILIGVACGDHHFFQISGKSLKGTFYLYIYFHKVKYLYKFYLSKSLKIINKYIFQITMNYLHLL